MACRPSAAELACRIRGNKGSVLVLEAYNEVKDGEDNTAVVQHHSKLGWTP
jgi:hypothetical protein